MATRREILASAAAASALGGLSPARSAELTVGPRERLQLDDGWRFHLGHAQDPARDFGFGAAQTAYAKAAKFAPEPALPAYDDTLWAPISIPHDWGVELPFIAPANLDPTLAEDPRAAHGYKPLGREFPDTSVGWYRRVIHLPAIDIGRRISLEFEGVFRDCMVFVNGYLLAENHSGYAPFRADISDVANYGAPTVVLLRVDASEGEGWFYEGAGVYRHVWLVKTDSVHVPQWGAVVRAEVAANTAALSITTEVVNEADQGRKGQVVSNIFDPKGKIVGQSRSDVDLKGWKTAMVDHAITLAQPALWSVQTPNLYRLETQILVDGAVVDRYATPFGVRTIRFDPERGFFLNGVSVKLKGTCNHQDHAGVGVALPDRLHEFRIERLKSMGSNAYRSAHNPPAPALLDACDRLGMLVIDENRRMSSDPESLDELERMIRRDRNRPSVILWSIGNEEPHQGNETGARIATTMKRLIERLDGTRLITEAMDAGWGDGVTRVLDVVGFNYRTQQMDAFHARFPQIPLIGTETGSTVTTRGVYVRDKQRQFPTAYDTEAPWWASTAEGWWPYVDARPYIAGGFIWTGFDYRGEPTPFNRWPSVASYFGVLDSCGFPKDAYYYYKGWWDNAPQAHLLPHWTWPGREGQPIDVWCYANVERVDLLLNGRSLGVKDVVKDGHLAWTVPYAPGVLEARGYRGGRLVVRDRRETAGPPSRLALTADRARLKGDGADVAVVSVEVLDAQGRPAPTAADRVTFDVSGAGDLIGVGNGDPTSHEADKASTRSMFNGLCMALIQSRVGGGSRIRVVATAPGLKGDVLLLASD